MVSIQIISRDGKVLDIIDRQLQMGEKGKLKGRTFVVYKNKRYIAEKDRFGMVSIFPWGYK